MDPNLHVKQAVNHLNRILQYYPFVQEGSEAVVALTPEDWWVVSDMLFHMPGAEQFVPEAIESYRLSEDGNVIELRTADCLIRVERV